MGLMDGPKPYRCRWFGDVDGPTPYRFRWFGDVDGPKPYKFIGFGVWAASGAAERWKLPFELPPLCRGPPPRGPRRGRRGR